MNMKPTILFVYPYVFNPIEGGIERVTDSITKELQKRGYCVKYLNLVKPNIVDDYKYAAPVYYFPSTDFTEPKNQDFYSEFLKNQKIDIVINQDACFKDSELFLSKLPQSQTKYISVFHGSPVLNYKYFVRTQLELKEKNIIGICKFFYRCLVVWNRRKKLLKERKYIFDFVVNNSDKVCLLSSSFNNDISTYLRRILPSNLVYIPNPFVFNDSKNIDISKKENIILFVGRLDMLQKRPDRIIKIWNQICFKYPDWKLYIVGDGPARHYLEKISASNRQIYFTGFQNPYPYYLKSKILCLTSNHEGWPMVLNEAMQCGVVPIVFESFSSVRDIIVDKSNGVLVTPFNMRLYEKELSTLIENEDILKRYALQAKCDVKRFYIDRIVDQWEQLFKNILNR